MPLVDDYSYKLGDGGVILNTDEISQPFVDITRISGFDSAPFRSTERDHEGTDGGFMDAEFEKGRPVTLEGTAYAVGSDLEPYLDALKANWAPSRTLIPLYLKKPGVTERILFIKPLGCRYDIDNQRRLGMARVQFVGFAEDPRIYDASLTSIDIYQGEQIITGRAYPRGYPYGYGAPTSIIGTNLTVSGNRTTPIRFSIIGPVTKPQIINETTGQSLIFDITMATDDNLVIDTQYRSVLLNGANRRSTLREPNWFFLNPGTNFIRFRAESYNLAPGPILNLNPFLEVDANNWTGQGGTIARSTAQFHEGVASLLLSPDGVTTEVLAKSDKVATEPGRLMRANAWVRCASSRTVYLSISWYDATQSFLSTTNATPVAVTANTWTSLQFETSGVANAQFAAMNVAMGSTPSGSHTLHIDEATIKGVFPTALNVQYRSAWR